MEAIKGLKYALVLVLIVSAILLGWTTYLERSQRHSIEQFAQDIGEARTESQAKSIIRTFLSNSNQAPVANTASADSIPCDWLCDPVK